jgi:hypothetical protein
LGGAILVSNILKKLTLLFYSTFSGVMVGGSIVTGIVAWLNFTARDGPNFPAPMVAFVLMVPVMTILVCFEIGVLGYELMTNKDLGKELFVFGLMGGLFPAILLHEILITTYQEELDLLRLLIFLGLGIVIGLTVFGSHWLGNRLWNYFDPPLINTD